MSEKNKAIFMDRDGVVNEEVSYLSNPNDFRFIEGSIEAMRILKNLGYLLIVITNQAGIARGYFTEKALEKIHQKMRRSLEENDITLDDIYYCPHHPNFTGPCECRKPQPGMILAAAKKYDIKLDQSYMVGDTLKDIETGYNAKVKTVLVMTGYGREEVNKINKIKPNLICENLLDFAENLKSKP
jgi:UDP-N-acetylmuramoyl-tripeptide--D-alanyl-D-alanine ligase